MVNFFFSVYSPFLFCRSIHDIQISVLHESIEKEPKKSLTSVGDLKCFLEIILCPVNLYFSHVIRRLPDVRRGRILFRMKFLRIHVPLIIYM